jgi:hypothetical protein
MRKAEKQGEENANRQINEVEEKKRGALQGSAVCVSCGKS